MNWADIVQIGLDIILCYTLLWPEILRWAPDLSVWTIWHVSQEGRTWAHFFSFVYIIITVFLLLQCIDFHYLSSCFNYTQQLHVPLVWCFVIQLIKRELWLGWRKIIICCNMARNKFPMTKSTDRQGYWNKGERYQHWILGLTLVTLTMWPQLYFVRECHQNHNGMAPTGSFFHVWANSSGKADGMKQDCCV